jgi:uracil-DNA glycosylase
MPKLQSEKLSWKEHKANWNSCQDCELCEQRNRVVLGKGKLPCDILFIGEAPGDAEDTLGKPFVGPAGHLLDKIISKVIPPHFRLAYTNLVGCIPKGSNNRKAKEPPRGSIEACSDRLKEFVRLAQPRVIVLVGKLPAKYITGQAMFSNDKKHSTLPWLNPAHNEYLEFVEILHPAFILRADESQKGLAIQRCEIILEDLVESDIFVPF